MARLLWVVLPNVLPPTQRHHTWRRPEIRFLLGDCLKHRSQTDILLIKSTALYA